MGEQTGIEWAEATLNPWTGCTKVSPGCANCYIDRAPPMRIAGRKFVRGHMPLTFHMERLEKMLRRKKPTLYFVNSLSDVFHEDVSVEVIAELFAAMARGTQHRFQVLTKRPDRMHALLNSRAWWEMVAARMIGVPAGQTLALWEPRAGLPVLPNVWLGVTIENRAHVARADLLRGVPAAVRFISAEPLLGSLLPPWTDERGKRDQPRGLNLAGIDWIIVGGESGSRRRQFDTGWARELLEESHALGVAFFMKQLGGLRPGTLLEDLPADLRVREFPA